MMESSNDIGEERIAVLLRALPPVPQGWMEAAQELPTARAGLDDLVARAAADADFRATVIADLEQALAQVGLEPHAGTIELLRQRLQE